MLICSQCQFENPLGNRFCQICGSLLSPDVKAAASGSSMEALSGAESEPITQVQALQYPVNDPTQAAEGAVPLTSAPAASEQPFSPIEAFATTPSLQSDCHPSFPLQSSSEPVADARNEAPTTQFRTPEQEMKQEREPEMGRDIGHESELMPDGIASMAANVTRESTEKEAMEESWDESTVWAGPADDEDDSPTIVLPMQLARLDSAGASHVGRQRDHNEDNFTTHTEAVSASGLLGQTFSAKGLYILCDGMGGHSGGEIASSMVVEELKRFFAKHWQDRFPDHATVRAAIASANQVVYDANESDDRLGNGRMGTTLVLVLIQGTQVTFAHVGDSRLYTYSRRQGLLQRTVDHEVGQLEVMRGVDPEIAYGRPESYQLTQALGPKDGDYINPSVEFMELQEDTLFLLCSDGLSDYSLVEDHAEEKVAPLLGSQAMLDQGVSDLVHLANEMSGHDNITAVVIRAKVRPDSKALA